MGGDTPISELLEARVTETFTRIWHDRMADVPILNPRLDVVAVGFRPESIGGHPAHVGVVVTPWFVNLLAIADDADADGVTAGKPVTETIDHVFPAGVFPFLVGEEAGLGRFAMCSLMSPVTQIEDQAAALAFAQAALDTVFDSDAAAEPSEEEVAVTTMWKTGQWVAPTEPEGEPEDTPADPVSIQDITPSRRAVITGGLAEDAVAQEPAE